MLVNGTVFDQADAFETKIGVGAVIGGWDKGVMEMSLGQVSYLTQPCTRPYC